jgi:hypothetical protein
VRGKAFKKISLRRRKTKPAAKIPKHSVHDGMTPLEKSDYDRLERQLEKQKQTILQRARGRAGRMEKARRVKALAVFRKFRPSKRKDGGKIIFVGLDGRRIIGRSNRRGYAVYVTRGGKARLLKEYSRKTGRIITPKAKPLKGLDVTRGPSKRARKEFLTQFLVPAARGEMTRTTKGLSRKAVRFAGEIKTTKFYEGGDAVEMIGRELSKASNTQKSRKDFLVSIGVWLKDKEGKAHFVEINRRFARHDGQATNLSETTAFLGREVYGHLSNELQTRGLVLSGSAGHVRRLQENRGAERDEWTKDGFLWQGHDSLDANIIKIEYRIDQQSFGK